MTLCSRCDRMVTAETACSFSDCPHRNVIAASRQAPSSAYVETINFDNSSPAMPDGNSAPDGATCPACGTHNMRGAKYCAGCGTAIGGMPIDTAAVQTSEFQPNSQSRNIGVAIAALLIIGLLAYLAFGKGSADKPALTDKPAPVVEAKPVKPIGQETTMWTVLDAIVRAKPTTKSSEIKTKIPRGTQLTGILQMGQDGASKWLWLADGSGYVGAITLSQSEPPKLVKIMNDQPWYAPDAVAIYALPDSASPQIATINQGEKITLAGITENGFAEAKLTKGVGYIAPGGYDFSQSKPPVAISGQGDIADFYTAMGLDGSAGPYIFKGSTSDQIIRLTIWSSSPKGEIASAEYRNSTTGNTCSSYMNLIGRDEKGRFRFNQMTAPKGNACQIYTDVVLSPSSGYVNAWWMQGDQTFMSAKLRM